MRGPKRWPHARCAEHAALCDALDGVLDKLRGMGDLAAPFLARVTKADAPKYADVVKCEPQPAQRATSASATEY